MPKVNLSGTRTELVPFAGTATLVIDKAEDAVSRSGNPMHKLQFSISDVHSCTSGDEESAKGQTVGDFITLTKDSLWKLKQFLIALGYERDELEGEVEYDSTDWLGCEIVAVLTIEKGTGSYPDRSKVARYVVPDDENEEPEVTLDFADALKQLADA